MALGVYRTALVWVLRVGAVALLASTLGTMALTVRDWGAAPATGMYALAQLLLNPLLFLAVAEILALLNQRSGAN